MTPCPDRRGDLAALALGLEAADDARRHVGGCASCRAALAELREAAAALAAADPARVDAGDEPVDPAIGERIVARIAREAAAARRRRRLRLLAVAAAVLALAGAGAGALAGGGGGVDGDDATTVHLAGPTGAEAEATLDERAWGTEVSIELRGLERGEVYWVWLTGDDGERVTAGTMAGTGADARAVLAAALPFDEVRRVWVTDAGDEVILDGWVR